MDGPMGIYVGNSAQSVKERLSAIMEILNYGDQQDTPTKQAALRALTKLCAVRNVTVSHCTIGNVGRDPRVDEAAPMTKRRGRPKKKVMRKKQIKK